MISIIIPTYNEKENVRKLITRIFSVLGKARIKAEVIVVDDNSPDGTGDAVRSLCRKYNVKLVKRKQKHGLASAVIHGFGHAKGDVIGVMDADLSHPPEKIPEMVRELDSCDLVLGSRYVRGGGIENWALKRRVISKGAILMARPLTPVKDPMSGFFFFRRQILRNTLLNPKGYKIGLELMVKGKHKKIKEIPYTFTDRKTGKSKLGVWEIFSYLAHVIGLYGYSIKKKL